MHTIFTIGHSTRTAEELIELLRRNGVGVLVDVRRYPGSRRHPQFNREELRRTLEAAGIGYRHEEALGGRRAEAGAGESSANAGWRNASFRAYADHLATAELRSALERVEGAAAASPVAVMCAEAVPWRCHRQLIADALVARGRDVRHIVSTSAPARHELNARAKVGADGVVTYPGEEPEQPELF